MYSGTSEVGTVTGSGRVSMAHSRTSQAVSVDGNLVEYRYDGTVRTVQNWPIDSGYLQYDFTPVGDILQSQGKVCLGAGRHRFLLHHGR